MKEACFVLILVGWICSKIRDLKAWWLFLPVWKASEKWRNANQEGIADLIKLIKKCKMLGLKSNMYKKLFGETGNRL